MVTRLGMSEALGPVVYTGAPSSYSAEVARVIDDEVRALIDEGAAVARRALSDARAAFDRLATALQERETLDSEQIEEVIATAPVLEPARPHTTRTA